MTSEWKERPLGDFVRLQRGHDLTASEQRPGKVPVMGSAGQNGTHSEALASGPGVVIGRSGASIGRVHFSQASYWPHNTCLYVTDFLNNNPRFAYYLLQTLNLAAYNSGSAQPSLNRNFVYSIPVNAPARAEQDEIVKVLEALDDRIALLRETNVTLEATAEALFKSWFVDFDPVRAKQEGVAPTGMDEATAALFPDAFEESPLGSVPAGWRALNIGSVFILTMGQAPPGHSYNVTGDGLPLYQGRTDFGFRFPTQRVFCTSPTRLAEVGDTLVSVRAPVGDVNMALERCCLGRGVASVRHPLRLRSFTFYSVLALRQHFAIFEGEGTVFGSINKKDFQALPIVEPASAVLIAFEDVVAPIDERVVANEEQIRTLITLRDALLPRLISGQLRLPEAEASLAEP